MSDIVFKSKYSIEEIEENFSAVDYFTGLKESLEDALRLEHESGKKHPSRSKSSGVSVC